MSLSVARRRLRRQRWSPFFSSIVPFHDLSLHIRTFSLPDAHIGSNRILVVSCAPANSPHFDINLVDTFTAPPATADNATPNEPAKPQVSTGKVLHKTVKQKSGNSTVQRRHRRKNGDKNRYSPLDKTKSSRPHPTKVPRWDFVMKAMPKNGMRFPDRAFVCHRIIRDMALWASVNNPFGFGSANIKAMRAAATAMVNSAVVAARQTKPPADYFEAVNKGNSSTANFEAFIRFLDTLRGIVPFAKEVSPPVFAEFFSEVIKARSFYFEHYKQSKLHVPSIEEHCQMALAVDKFLNVAWFWDDTHSVLAAEGEQLCNEDNVEEKEEKLGHVQHEKPVADDDASGSLATSLNGVDV